MKETPQTGLWPSCGNNTDGPWCSQCGERQGPLHVSCIAFIAEAFGIPSTHARGAESVSTIARNAAEAQRAREVAPLILFAEMQRAADDALRQAP